MSFLNGLAAAGAGLSSFAQIAGKEQILDQDRDRRSLDNAMSLLNRAPGAATSAAAPVAESKPAAAAPVVAPPEGDSAAHGNALDPATVDRAHAIHAGLVERGLDP